MLSPAGGTPVGGRPVGRKMMGFVLLLFALVSTAVARGQAQAPPVVLSGLQVQPAPADIPTITYRRVFQGSTPEFIEIVVRQDGSARADVRQLNEAVAPKTFEVGPAVRAKIFEMARALRNFQGADLGVHRRVAYLGQKTFRWEKGAEAYETQYNYTLDTNASKLQMIFEGLAQQQIDLGTLEQKLRYDRLGVNDALRQFEHNVNQRTLPEPERFLPVLDRIAEDTRLIEMARQRARSLAARIRTAQAR
ncbi:MAG TPA: hypothetical protein VIG89_00410 [Candidatus Acidoferrales bacterium]